MTLRLLLLAAWLVLPGCQNFSLPEFSLPEFSLPTITMPRIGFGEEPEPVIPVSVAYAFDASVTEARIETQACGLPLTLNSGEIIPQAFLAAGQKTFQSVSAYEGAGEAVHAAQPNDLTIQIGLIHQSLEEVDRIAEEDNYLVFLNLQLQAVFLDRDGKELAHTPLRFSGQMQIWAPALTGQSISCATGQYDEAIRSAAHELAGQLTSVVPDLLANGAPQSPAIAGRTDAPAAPASLTFRTRLKDANSNLILEAGETIVLEIEAAHTGSRALASAQANLTGSAVLIKAFSGITPLPVALGAFQPGETKTTEIRGRMPLTVREPTGELVVTLTPGEGTPIGSHRILAPLQDNRPVPATDGRPAVASQAGAPIAATDGRPAIASQAGAPIIAPPVREEPPAREDTRPPAEDYVAILVGMNAYRDDWPDAYRIPAGHLDAVRDVLETTGTFTGPNIRVLEGSHAAKSDVEEALFTWGRQRIGADSVLLMYFSGQAVKNPESGEVYLVPYEGSPDASANRLMSLRALQRALGTFENRMTLLLLDAPLLPWDNTPASGPGAKGSRPARWDGGLPRRDDSPVMHIRKIPGRGDGDPAGVFAGLFGGTEHAVTVGEFLKGASSVSEIIPTLPASSPVFDIPLAQEMAGADTNEPVLPESAEPDAANLKPVTTNDLLPEPTTLEPVVSEPVIPESVISEPVVSESVIPEPVISEPVIPEPVVPEPVISESVISEPVTPEPVIPEPVIPEPVIPEPVVPEPVIPEPVVPEPVIPESTTGEPVTPEEIDLSNGQ